MEWDSSDVCECVRGSKQLASDKVNQRSSDSGNEIFFTSTELLRRDHGLYTRARQWIKDLTYPLF